MIPSGGGGAATAGGGEGKGKGNTTRVMVGRKRGWHARNRYSRAAKKDRLSEEKEGRKRAREDVELVGDGSGEEEDWEEAGRIAETRVAGGFYGEAGEANMKELLRLAQVRVCFFLSFHPLRALVLEARALLLIFRMLRDKIEREKTQTRGRYTTA